jgi:hypothetical protein
MLIRQLILILVLLVCGCNKPKELSKVDTYFDKKLNNEKSATNFEEDSEYGYIKIGNFLNLNVQSAIVISFDSIKSLKVYELQNDTWQKVYQTRHVNLKRIYPLQTFVADYNFDGIKDIGIKNEVSNSSTNMTFHLWLSAGNSYKYIPEFEFIGSPMIIKEKKIVRGFKACCMFNEITICDYYWQKNTLIKIRELDIRNYPSGIVANQKNLNEKTEQEIHLTRNDISKIIDAYCENWKLHDSHNLQ